MAVPKTLHPAPAKSEEQKQFEKRAKEIFGDETESSLNMTSEQLLELSDDELDQAVHEHQAQIDSYMKERRLKVGRIMFLRKYLKDMKAR